MWKLNRKFGTTAKEVAKEEEEENYILKSTHRKPEHVTSGQEEPADGVPALPEGGLDYIVRKAIECSG